MIRYEFHYTVGAPQICEFPNEAEARWAIHNEGDHLLKAVRLPSKVVTVSTAKELNAQCDLKAPMPDDLLEWDRMPPVGKERE